MCVASASCQLSYSPSLLLRQVVLRGRAAGRIQAVSARSSKEVVRDSDSGKLVVIKCRSDSECLSLAAAAAAAATTATTTITTNVDCSVFLKFFFTLA